LSVSELAKPITFAILTHVLKPATLKYQTLIPTLLDQSDFTFSTCLLSTLAKTILRGIIKTDQHQIFWAVQNSNEKAK
jgi:hypothetical protein